MELKKIGLSDETFYYGFSGKKTTDIIVNVTMKYDIDALALNKAVQHLVKVYPYLCKKIVVKGNNIYYADNAETPVAYEWDKKQHKLGTAETNYFLFRVMHKKNEIIMIIHHGLLDGKGVFEVVQSLLDFYVEAEKLSKNDELSASDMEISSEDNKKEDYKVKTDEKNNIADVKNGLENNMADNMGDAEDLYEKYGDINQKPFYIYKNNGAFVIPEQYYAEDDTSCRKFKVICEMNDVLSLAKRSQSTPVPVLAAIISETIDSIYETDNKDITGYIPVDLRKMFNYDSISNTVMAITLPYSKRLNDKSMDIKCTVLRGIMDLQIQKENFVYRMGQQVVNAKQREALEVPAEAKQNVYIDRLTKGSRSMYTYLLSYVGKLNFSDRVSQELSDFNVCLPAYLVPLNIIACVDGSKLILTCTQNFKTDKIIKKMVEIMEAKGISASYEDMGEIQADPFEFAKLQHI